MIATDLLRAAWSNLYDVAILVSGDGDFTYAVRAVKDIGKHVEVAAFQANLSMELAQIADDREYFTPEYFSQLWSRKRGGEKGGDLHANGGRIAVRTARATPEGHVEHLRPGDFAGHKD